MNRQVQNLIIGQGLAGSAMAWTLHFSGQEVLIVDRGEAATASRVSAGLITPLTGKRLVKSTDFSDYWTAAKSFYRRVEQSTGASLFEETTMLRLFADEEGRARFLSRSDSEAADGVELWSGILQPTSDQQYGIRMSPAGRLDVAAYLRATREYFEQRGCYSQTEIDWEMATMDEQPGGSSITTTDGTVDAERIIVCSGASKSQLFPMVPDNPSRGDILEVSIPGYQQDETVHRSVWIASTDKGGRQLVGSTYDWNNLSNEPTEEGRRQILSQLERLVEGEIAVLQQTAAVRPTMKDYEPVIGRHPTRTNVFILNGLGSKGALRSPLLAHRLQTMIEGKAEVPDKQNVARLTESTLAQSGGRWTGVQRPLTVMAQQAVATALKKGDIAVDATVGNGFDTVFLSESVGENGRVIGFDLQQMALDSTDKRLKANGRNNVELIRDSHEHLGVHVKPESVSAVMFNLGYLPRSDKTVVTKADSSTAAISAAVDGLKLNGILTVLAYRGHEGGQEEFEAVENLLGGLSESFALERINSQPPKATSPVLFVLRKQPPNSPREAGPTE